LDHVKPYAHLTGLRRFLAKLRWKLDRKKRWLAALRREAFAEHEAIRREIGLIRLHAEERIAALEIRLRAAESGARLAGECAQRLGLVETLLTDALAPEPAAPTEPRPDAPEVSIVMPVLDRAGVVAEAIESVMAQSHRDWELLLVDDGSNDDLAGAVARYLSDPRIRLLRQARLGAAAARNAALRGARGTFIAYLDSDNIWAPDFLARAIAALRAEPEIDLVYGVLSTSAHRLNEAAFLFRPFDRDSLEQGNYIDINVVVHRAGLARRLGGFDESLDRLCDWDLILRYTVERSALAIPVLGARYRVLDSQRISDTAPFWPNAVAIHDKLYPPPALRRPLRVLYVVWHYPQLSETYIETEIRQLRQWGAQIEVWRSEDVASPYPTHTTVHSGSLREAVAAAQPDLIHVHWLSFALGQSEALAAVGLPVTLRLHGFDVTADALRAFLDHPWARGVYAFPGQIGLLNAPDGRIRPLPAAFDTKLFRPCKAKDRRLIVRMGSALKSKDIVFFFDLARRLPEFRFVYAGITCKFAEAYAEEIRVLHQRTNSPVEVRFDVPRDEVAALMGRAGIHVHTACPAGAPHATPLGQPVSIAEGMATGAYTLARNAPEFRDYIGCAGAFYDDLDDAERLVRATLDWSDEDWRAVQSRAIERAFSRHADSMVYRTLYEDWSGIVDETRSVTPPNCR
jgi:glycosyltransferase involved in cell wall biosynthesis